MSRYPGEWMDEQMDGRMGGRMGIGGRMNVLMHECFFIQ